MHLQVDGWTDLQCEMDHYGFTSSHVFIVVFILLGNFVFFNMLIALVITKTQVMRALCIECACVCEHVWLCVSVRATSQQALVGKLVLGSLQELASGAARNILDTEVPNP